MVSFTTTLLIFVKRFQLGIQETVLLFQVRPLQTLNDIEHSLSVIYKQGRWESWDDRKQSISGTANVTCPNNDSADNRSIIASTTTNNYVFTTSSYAIDCDQTLLRRAVIYHYQNTMQKKSYLMILIKNRTFEPGNKLSRTEEKCYSLTIFLSFFLRSDSDSSKSHRS